MIGVGFEILARTPVPQLPPSYPPAPTTPTTPSVTLRSKLTPVVLTATDQCALSSQGLSNL